MPYICIWDFTGGIYFKKYNYFFFYDFRLKDDLNSNVTHAMSQINKRYFNNDLGPKSIAEFQNQFGKLYTDSIYSSVVHLFSLKV